jgi:hypothetical protein
MIPVDYELGRQYCEERLHEASTRRVAREAAAARYPRVTFKVPVLATGVLRAWVGGMLFTGRAAAHLAVAPLRGQR